MSPGKRYNVLRTCLVFSVCLTMLLVAPVLSVDEGMADPSPARVQLPPLQQDDRGSRYHLCFTATDSYYNQTTTKCMYVTVVGACTLSTADVNIDGLVDIGDLSIVALHYHENNTGPQPYNPLNTSTVGLEDLACVALFYHQTDPLP